MSLYVSWMNAIKLGAQPDWLTSGQRPAFDALLSKWQGHRHVALVGAEGSGKSFIARLLHSHAGYAYAHEIAEAPRGAPLVVVDANDYSRLYRPLADELGLGRVVWTLRRPPLASDAVPFAEIQLSETDRNQFKNRLLTSEIIRGWRAEPLDGPLGVDLGLLLRREAIARAETLSLGEPALSEAVSATASTSDSDDDLASLWDDL